jgi:hypothetical protein
MFMVLPTPQRRTVQRPCRSASPVRSRDMSSPVTALPAPIHTRCNFVTDEPLTRRHLASLWEQTFLSPSHPLSKRRYGPTPNTLDTIDVLVLLDLLGHRASRIISNYRETDWLHGEMGSADKRLREAGLIEVERGQEGWFPTNMKGNAHMIGDDHVPVSWVGSAWARCPVPIELGKGPGARVSNQVVLILFVRPG